MCCDGDRAAVDWRRVMEETEQRLTGDVLWGRQDSGGLETCYGGDRAAGD